MSKRIQSATRPLPGGGRIRRPISGATMLLPLCAVVVMVTVDVCGAPGAGVTVAGEKEQLALAGSPLEQLSATGRLKPFTDDVVTVYVVDCPATISVTAGVADMEKD